MTHHVPCTKSSLTPSNLSPNRLLPHNAEIHKSIILGLHPMIILKNKFICFQTKSFWMLTSMIIYFQKSMCLLWVANFSGSHRRLRKPSYTFTSLDVVPFSEPAQSKPNAVLIYNHANRGTLLDVVQGTVSTTHSPRMVNDNSHAYTPISCDVPVHMKCNYAISCL